MGGVGQVTPKGCGWTGTSCRPRGGRCGQPDPRRRHAAPEPVGGGRQIRALEESLNTTLFRRHARGLLLTEQGELFRRDADDVEAAGGGGGANTRLRGRGAWRAPGHDDDRLRHAVAGAAAAPAVRALSKPEDRADAGGAHPRPADARGGRGDPAEGAEPGRADPAAADGGPTSGSMLEANSWRAHGLPRDDGGTRRAPADHAEPGLAAGPGRGGFVQRLLAAAPGVVAGGEQLFRHPAGGDPRPRDRIAARTTSTGDFPIWSTSYPEEKSAPIPIYLAYVEELRHSKRVCGVSGFHGGGDRGLPERRGGAPRRRQEAAASHAAPS